MNALLGLTESLRGTVERISPSRKRTRWMNYYRDGIDPKYVETKKQIVESAIEQASPERVWDVGANDGTYSRLISASGIRVLSMDSDPKCVDEAYLASKETGDRFLHPLFLDITNPSPGIGWANNERLPFLARSKPDLIVAFAVLHHLTLGQHIRFELLADLFSCADHLLIEFLERDDSRVREVISPHAADPAWYTRENFEQCFSRHFDTLARYPTGISSRSVYLMKSKRAD